MNYNPERRNTVIDSKRIEEEAVGVLKKIIWCAELLSPNLSENDKGPCWDGYIAVYEDNQKKKESGIRRVPVQVKGISTIDGANQEYIKYDVDTADLEAYREDGGCIFFVVTEKYEGNILKEHHVFYQELLPFKIYKIKSNLKNQSQKTIRVEFKRFPDDPDEITSIFLQFLENRVYQSAFSAQSVPEFHLSMKKRPIEIPIKIYSREKIDPAQLLLKSDAYLYCKDDETGTLFPVDLLNRDGETEQVFNCEVKVKDKVYYDSVKIIKRRKSSKVVIGKSVSLIREGEKSTFSISMTHFIRQFVKDYEFIKAVIKYGSFSLGGGENTLDKKEIKGIKEFVKKYENDYKTRKKIEKLLYELGCCDEIDTSVDIDACKIQGKDSYFLCILYKAIVEKKTITGIQPSEGAFIKFAITDKSIVLQIDKKRKRYSLKSIEQSNWKMVQKATEEDIEIPLFSILKKDEYISCLNIDFDKVFESIKSVPQSVYLYMRANDIGLQMLLAMTESHGIRRKRLYDSAIRIFDWLNTINTGDWDTRVSMINKYLARKWNGDYLSQQDIDVIKEIIDDTDDNMIRFSAYVLLEENNRAQRFYGRLEPEKQKWLRGMPIYHFWKS